MYPKLRLLSHIKILTHLEEIIDNVRKQIKIHSWKWVWIIESSKRLLSKSNLSHKIPINKKSISKDLQPQHEILCSTNNTLMYCKKRILSSANDWNSKSPLKFSLLILYTWSLSTEIRTAKKKSVSIALHAGKKREKKKVFNCFYIVSYPCHTAHWNKLKRNFELSLLEFHFGWQSCLHYFSLYFHRTHSTHKHTISLLIQ